MGYGTVNVGYPSKIGKPGGSDAYGSASAVQANLNSHTNNKSNPHGVTASQVGADPAGSAASALSSAKSYTDTLIGNINSVLDAINGEVI